MEQFVQVCSWLLGQGMEMYITTFMDKEVINGVIIYKSTHPWGRRLEGWSEPASCLAEVEKGGGGNEWFLLWRGPYRRPWRSVPTALAEAA